MSQLPSQPEQEQERPPNMERSRTLKTYEVNLRDNHGFSIYIKRGLEPRTSQVSIWENGIQRDTLTFLHSHPLAVRNEALAIFYRMYYFVPSDERLKPLMELLQAVIS